MLIFIVGPSKRTYEFPVQERFLEGHRCSAGEARALNLLLAEAVGKNHAGAIRKAEVASPEALCRLEDLAVLAQKIEAYAKAYQFQALPWPRRRGDIEAEALLVAQARGAPPESVEVRREARERLIRQRGEALRALEEL